VAGLVANGAAPGLLGGAPISSALGVDLGAVGDMKVLDPVVGDLGVFNSMSDLSSVVQGITSTTSQAWFGNLGTTLTAMTDSVIPFNDAMKDAWGTIATNAAAGGLEVFTSTLGAYGAEASNFLSSVTSSGFSTALGEATAWASKTLGGNGDLISGVLSGDPSKLGSIFNSALSYVDSANGMIAGAAGGLGALAKTFSGMENAISGGLSGLSNFAQGVGLDMAKLGDTLSLQNLSNLGSPGQLLKNMEGLGNFGPMLEKLGSVRIDELTAGQMGLNVPKSVFSEFQNVAGSLSSLGDSLGENVRGALSSFETNITSALSSAAENISGSLSSSGIIGALSSAAENISGSLTGPLTEAEIELRRASEDFISGAEGRAARRAAQFPEFFSSSVPLKDLGVDIAAVAKRGADLPAVVQKQIFNKLENLTTKEVDQVKSILNNTQTAITKGQDFLDPRKLFSGCFGTLTTPVRTASKGFRSIYEDSTGAVNPQLNHLGQNLKGIIPDDLAVANDALSRSMLQIKGIQNSSIDVLANTMSEMENLEGLSLIKNQTQYVIPEVAKYWEQQYNQDTEHNSGIRLCTGVANTLVLSDVVGFAAGYNSGTNLKENATLLASLESAGAFVEFKSAQGIYETIQEFCIGTFGPVPNPSQSPGNPDDDYKVTIPAGWAAAGTYYGATAAAAFQEAWVNGIVPYTAVASTDIYANYPDARTVNFNEAQWQNQHGREYLNRQRADIVVEDVVANKNQAIALGTNLSTYGKDTSFGGAAMWLERTANVASLGGQAIIAAMREGRNQARLDRAGLGQDLSLSNNVTQLPGGLAPSQYDKEQTESQIIRS